MSNFFKFILSTKFLVIGGLVSLVIAVIGIHLTSDKDISPLIPLLAPIVLMLLAMAKTIFETSNLKKDSAVQRETLEHIETGVNEQVEHLKNISNSPSPNTEEFKNFMDNMQSIMVEYQELKGIKTEVMALRDEVRLLRQENADMRRENTELKDYIIRQQLHTKTPRTTND